VAESRGIIKSEGSLLNFTNMNNLQQEFKNLNSAQKDAVETIYWPVMVIAWPWTWKTQIIWLRTANIILKAWVNPENILITTFTDAWVVAIKQRLLKFLWPISYKVWVSTIHSFASEVIASFPEKFIEFRALSLIDEVESYEILTQIFDKLCTDWKIESLVSSFDKYYYLREIKQKIDVLKKEWITFASIRNSFVWMQQELDEKKEEALNNKRIKDPVAKIQKLQEDLDKQILRLEELMLISKEYWDFLKNAWKYDFNDMIEFVLTKFQEDDDLKMHYAEKYQFVMIDEFQDTNNPQNEIFNLIMSVWESRNIMVVWDDDQSIYRFAWANIENMLDFTVKYNDTKVIVLTQNYRSNQYILDASKSLIDNNFERISKRLSFVDKTLVSSWALSNSNSKVKVYEWISTIEEKVFIIDKISKKLESWLNPKEIAIIVRSNSEVKLCEIFT